MWLWLLWGFGTWAMLGTLSYLIVDTWPRLENVGWVWYSFVQLIMLVAMVDGWFLLIPFCLARAWVADAVSIKDGRTIDVWRWRPLNVVYGNREDGVSGIYARIGPTGSAPYMPGARDWWRAYCWSAWRNSCDNLKYEFAWNNGPYAEWLSPWGKRFRFGWFPENGLKVPVF